MFNSIIKTIRKYNPIHVLYPPLCRSCNCSIPQNSVFCDACAKQIKPIVSSFVAVTKKYAIKVFSASDYKDPLRSLILRKSFSDIVASKDLATIMFEHTQIKNMEFDYIIPVPLHWTRYAKRGYNQAEVMAKFLSKKLHIPVLNILKRKKRTPFQFMLTLEKRKENVKNVFVVKNKYLNNYKELLKDKRILFVDDLCTTGATLKNTARVLVDASPQSLFAVVACRVV
jgi:competence protein ComFC